MAGPKISKQQFDADVTADEWAEIKRWVNVVSSNVRAIQYDQEQRILWVEFDDSSIYYYDQVGPDLAKQMFNCDSHGKFVWHLRKMGHKGIKVR